MHIAVISLPPSLLPLHPYTLMKRQKCPPDLIQSMMVSPCVLCVLHFVTEGQLFGALGKGHSLVVGCVSQVQSLTSQVKCPHV